MTKFLIGFFIGAILVALIFRFNPEKTHTYSVILNDGDTLIIPSKVTGYVGLAKTITTKPDSTVFDTFQYNHHTPGKSDIHQKHWSLYSVKCNEDSHTLDTMSMWIRVDKTYYLDTTYSSLFMFKNKIDSFNNIIDTGAKASLGSILGSVTLDTLKHNQ